MKSILTLSFVIFLIIFSCKKKEDTRTVESTTQLSTSTTGNTQTAASATFNALCSNQKIYSIIGNYTYSSSVAQNSAAFTNSVLNNFNTYSGAYLDAGNISLNSVQFKNNASYYSDSTNSVFSDPFVWTGTGSVIPAFSFSNTNAFASYAGYISWPDTIRKTSDFSITLTSLQRADEAKLYISIAGGPLVQTYTALVSSGNINVTAAGIAALSTSTQAIIQCDFFKNNIQIIGGKQVNFRNVTSFVKTVGVTN